MKPIEVNEEDRKKAGEILSDWLSGEIEKDEKEKEGMFFWNMVSVPKECFDKWVEDIAGRFAAERRISELIEKNAKQVEIIGDCGKRISELETEVKVLRGNKIADDKTIEEQAKRIEELKKSAQHDFDLIPEKICKILELNRQVAELEQQIVELKSVKEIIQ